MATKKRRSTRHDIDLRPKGWFVMGDNIQRNIRDKEESFFVRAPRLLKTISEAGPEQVALKNTARNTLFRLVAGEKRAIKAAKMELLGGKAKLSLKGRDLIAFKALEKREARIERLKATAKSAKRVKPTAPVVKTRSSAETGYLSTSQLIERAKEKGYLINRGKLEQIRDKERNPNRPKGWLFPEEKLHRIIADSSATLITPRGYFTAKDLMSLAKKQGLKITAIQIRKKIDYMWHNEELAKKQGRNRIEGKWYSYNPPIKGLARDIVNRKHQWIYPQEFANLMLKEARLRKKVPDLLKKGELIPFSQLAKELGVTVSYLYRRQVPRTRIGQNTYVPKADAVIARKRFEERGGKLPKIKQRTRKQRAAAGKNFAKNQMKEEIEYWLEDVLPTITSDIIQERIRKLVLKNSRLSYQQFRKEIFPKLNKLLEGRV